MKRDPSKVVDATGERSVDWDREVKEGNLSRVTPLTRPTADPTYQHIQGKPMSDQQAQARIRPVEYMRETARTQRYPDTSTSGGKSTFGGWPTFKDGKVVSEEDSL